MMKRHVISVLLCVSMVLSQAACGGQNNKAEEKTSAAAASASSTASNEPSVETGADVLRVGVMIDIVTLGYPGKLQSQNELMVVQPAVETLCRYDSEGKLIPWLCDSFEEDADNLTLTVKLKQGIKFQDGTDFNAEAVKWNWEEFIAQGRTEINALDSVEVKDEYTVVAHLNRWDNAFADSALYMGGFMFSPSYCKEKGIDAASAHPVGTGPFKFESWEKDVKVVYTKNEDYWSKGASNVNEIDIILINDSNTMAAVYLTGGIDVLPILSQDTRALLLAQGKKGVVSEAVLGGASMLIMAYGCTDPSSPFTDINLRKAVSYAVDNAAIASATHSGDGYILTTQWGMPGAWSYNDSVEGYTYSPEKAKEYLTVAGKPNGLDFKCYTITANNTMAEMIQGYLEAVGIKMTIENIDQAKSDEMSGIGGNWDGIILSAARCDAELASIYARTFTDGGVRYVGGMLHPEDVANLIGKATNAKTFEEKQKYNQELAGLVSSYNMIQPLWIEVPVYFCADSVTDSGFYKTHMILWTPEAVKLNK